MATGAFDLEETNGRFDLKPNTSPIPTDQHKVQLRFYDTWNVLKLLKTRGEFRKDTEAFEDLEISLKEVAKAGCVVPHANPDSALEALEQIRGYVISLTGRRIVNRYLAYLAAWAVGGAVVLGGVVELLARPRVVPDLRGYGWVLMGSMAGAWASVANRRREISFEEIPEFLDFRLEPFVRMLFVAVIATIVALGVQKELVTVSFGSLKFSTFAASAGKALLLGLIAGVSERALSVRLIKRLSEVGASATSSLL
jgi:hypothetical protein